jgi:hypothetical protein
LALNNNLFKKKMSQKKTLKFQGTEIPNFMDDDNTNLDLQDKVMLLEENVEKISEKLDNLQLSNVNYQKNQDEVLKTLKILEQLVKNLQLNSEKKSENKSNSLYKEKKKEFFNGLKDNERKQQDILMRKQLEIEEKEEEERQIKEKGRMKKEDEEITQREEEEEERKQREEEERKQREEEKKQREVEERKQREVEERKQREVEERKQREEEEEILRNEEERKQREEEEERLKNEERIKIENEERMQIENEGNIKKVIPLNKRKGKIVKKTNVLNKRNKSRIVLKNEKDIEEEDENNLDIVIIESPTKKLLTLNSEIFLENPSSSLEPPTSSLETPNSSLEPPTSSSKTPNSSSSSLETPAYSSLDPPSSEILSSANTSFINSLDNIVGNNSFTLVDILNDKIVSDTLKFTTNNNNDDDDDNNDNNNFEFWEEFAHTGVIRINGDICNNSELTLVKDEENLNWILMGHAKLNDVTNDIISFTPHPLNCTKIIEAKFNDFNIEILEPDELNHGEFTLRFKDGTPIPLGLWTWHFTIIFS